MTRPETPVSTTSGRTKFSRFANPLYKPLTITNRISNEELENQRNQQLFKKPVKPDVNQQGLRNMFGHNNNFQNEAEQPVEKQPELNQSVINSVQFVNGQPAIPEQRQSTQSFIPIGIRPQNLGSRSSIVSRSNRSSNSSKVSIAPPVKGPFTQGSTQVSNINQLFTQSNPLRPTPSTQQVLARSKGNIDNTIQTLRRRYITATKPQKETIQRNISTLQSAKSLNDNQRQGILSKVKQKYSLSGGSRRTRKRKPRRKNRTRR